MKCADASVQIWSLVTLRDGAWHLQLVKRLMHTEPSRENAELHISAITSVLAMSQAVYTGDEDGKVVSFYVFVLGGRC